MHQCPGHPQFTHKEVNSIATTRFLVRKFFSTLVAIGCLRLFLLSLIYDLGEYTNINELSFADNFAILCLCSIVVLLRIGFHTTGIIAWIIANSLMPLFWQLTHEALPHCANPVINLLVLIVGTYISVLSFAFVYLIDNAKLKDVFIRLSPDNLIILFVFSLLFSLSFFFVMREIQSQYTWVQCTYWATLSPSIANLILGYLCSLRKKNKDKKEKEEKTKTEAEKTEQ